MMPAVSADSVVDRYHRFAKMLSMQHVSYSYRHCNLSMQQDSVLMPMSRRHAMGLWPTQ